MSFKAGSSPPVTPPETHHRSPSTGLSPVPVLLPPCYFICPTAQTPFRMLASHPQIPSLPKDFYHPFFEDFRSASWLGRSVSFMLSNMKLYMFFPSSWIATLSYCHGLPKNRWHAYSNHITPHLIHLISIFSSNRKWHRQLLEAVTSFPFLSHSNQ